MKVEKMNKQNETVLLEHLADTFETKLREADRSIGTDIPNQYREGWMDAFGWRPPTAAYWRNGSEPMLDFSKWEAMWDTYNRMAKPCPAVPQAYAKTSA